MDPWDFGRLSPGEFMDKWDGYKWRQEQEENRLAYFTACLMSVHTKKPVSPKDLIKPLRPAVNKRQSKKEDEDYMKDTFGM